MTTELYCMNIPAGKLAGPQRICLSSIFREDDPAVVRRCLESARPFLSAWAIVDTGSSDAVKATIRDVLSDIPGTLVEREWPDSFAIARNWALDAAGESGCDVAMFLDASDYIAPNYEDEITGLPVLPPLPRISTLAVLMSTSGGGYQYLRTMFARLCEGYRWRYEIHEEIDPEGAKLLLIDQYIVACTQDGASSKDPDRKSRYYIEKLRRRLAATPDDVAGWLYLANELIYRRDSREDEVRECANRIESLMACDGAQFTGRAHALRKAMRSAATNWSQWQTRLAELGAP